MSAQHTPGPWDRGRADGCTQVYGADGTLIANVEPVAGNSRLIAAAPDLLEALQGAMDALGSECFDWGPARAAIAKAIGSAS